MAGGKKAFAKDDLLRLGGLGHHGRWQNLLKRQRQISLPFPYSLTDRTDDTLGYHEEASWRNGDALTSSFDHGGFLL